MKSHLKYPSDYNEVLAKKYNNGCGPAGWKGKLVPDTIYGLSISEPCKIHDFMYEVGDHGTDKFEADSMFHINLLHTIKYESKWWNRFLNPLRRKRAWIYYTSVRYGGREAFYSKVES